MLSVCDLSGVAKLGIQFGPVISRLFGQFPQSRQ